MLPDHPRFANLPLRYGSALDDGIVADGNAGGMAVTALRRPTAQALPQPDMPPIAQADATTCLAAMVVRRDGFHFLRRDSATGLWSHRNGAQDAEVETFASIAASGRPVVIDDAVTVELLRNSAACRSSFPNFGFAAYLLVPTGGIAVS